MPVLERKVSELSEIAVIWDLNGVIIDDMRFHFEALHIFLRELNYNLTEEEFIARCTGASPKDFFTKLLPSIGSPMSVEEAVIRKTNLYFRQIKGRMQMLPGVRALIKNLHDNNVKEAIASGATRIEVDTILDEFRISNYFGATVASEDVSVGKPDPEPFLTAASRLGVNPENCIVIEDGEFGVRAAKNGGMKVIAVTNTQAVEKLAAADIIVDSLEKVDVEVVRNLVSEPVAL